jgi:hypothetical protein
MLPVENIFNFAGHLAGLDFGDDGFELIAWIREARPRRLDPFLVNSREVTSPISRGDAREP